MKTSKRILTAILSLTMLSSMNIGLTANAVGTPTPLQSSQEEGIVTDNLVVNNYFYRYHKVSDSVKFMEIMGFLPNDTHTDTLIIPDTINGVPVERIADRAFSYRTDLKEVRLGANLKSIGAEAFNKCSGLTKVLIPPSVDEIGVDAFAGCISLTNFTFMNKTFKCPNTLGYDEVNYAVPLTGLTDWRHQSTECIAKNCTIRALSEAKFFNQLGNIKRIDAINGIAPDGRLYCDVNGDGEVDVSDAQTTLRTAVRALAGLGPDRTDALGGTMYYETGADDIIDVADAQRILMFYVRRLAQLNEPIVNNNVQTGLDDNSRFGMRSYKDFGLNTIDVKVTYGADDAKYGFSNYTAI